MLILNGRSAIKESGSDYYVKCCLGFAFSNNLLQLSHPLEQTYFICDIYGVIEMKLRDKEEALSEFDSLGAMDKCLISDGQIIKYQGIYYKEYWLG